MNRPLLFNIGWNAPPYKERKYASCDAPIGDYCKKHGCTHKETKGDDE